ncbi:MAG: cell division protein SepF [Candidatus Bathyarchaeales archaeon]
MPSLSNPFRRSRKEEKETAKIGAKMVQGKTFLKAMPLRDLADLDAVKSEVRSGNILILRITPLASKSVEDVKRAVNELCEFAESVGGDIARLGEERIVICPPNVKIWREKTPVASEPIPTAA